MNNHQFKEQRLRQILREFYCYVKDECIIDVDVLVNSYHLIGICEDVIPHKSVVKVHHMVLNKTIDLTMPSIWLTDEHFCVVRKFICDHIERIDSKKQEIKEQIEQLATENLHLDSILIDARHKIIVAERQIFNNDTKTNLLNTQLSELSYF